MDRWEIIDLIAFHLAHTVTVEMVKRRIDQGEQEYGNFEIETIDFPRESLEEILDLIAYHFGEKLKDGKR